MTYIARVLSIERLPRRYTLLRDIVGTLVPFAGFLVLAAFAAPSGIAGAIAQVDAALKAIDGGVAVVSAYVAIGYFAGKLVGAAGVWLTRLATRLPRVGQRCSYAAWYERQRKPIEQLFAQVYAGMPSFELSLTDRVNALKSFYAKTHPEGLAGVNRQIMLLDITRAGFVYSLILLASEALAPVPHNTGLALLCAAILLVCAVATPRRIEKVVRTEMVFLLAAARLGRLQD